MRADPPIRYGKLIDQELVRSLFDQLSDVVFFTKDHEGRYVLVNRTLVERTGARSSADLIGRTAAEVFPWPLGQGYSAQDRLVLDTGIEIRDRLELHLYPGHRQGWCLTFKAPLRGVQGASDGLVGISRDLHRADRRHPEYERLAEAVRSLTDDGDAPLRLADVARSVGLSIGRLERLSRRVFHLTPQQVLTKHRIEKASRLLAEGKRTIAEVAHACGYSDHSAFTRQFRATVGLTPSQMRARAKAGARESPGSPDEE